MIKFLSLASVSVLSSVCCNAVNATSCANMNANGHEKHAGFHEIFSICLDGDGLHNDSHKIHYQSAFSSRLHGFDNDHGRYSGGHGLHDSKADERDESDDRHKSEYHSKHDFDWSDSDLEKHNHAHHGDDGYNKHDDAEHDKSHDYGHDHGHEHWYKDVKDHDYGAAVVPVPSAAWLFASGLVGLAVVSRRKRRL